MARSRARSILVLLGILLVLCAGLLGWLDHTVRPPAAAPDLPHVVRRQSSPSPTMPGAPDRPVSERRVQVYCAGLPNNECGTMLVLCTTPRNIVGRDCYQPDDESTVCLCPAGEAAIRGGGRSVHVEADQTEAWLDFRDSARISGRLVRDGVPVNNCWIRALRVPEGLEDLPQGVVATGGGNCEEDGRFEVDGLVPGDWQFMFRSYDPVTLEEAERWLLPLRLSPGDRRDLGDVELQAGGVIAGVLVDGLTGEPVERGGVVAWRHAASGERVSPAGTDADDDGHFRLTGLTPGTWTVLEPFSPQEAKEVEVREGETATVELRTSDATVLSKNGFALGKDEDDGLVVLDVEAGKPAEKAGLQVGDTVVGVRMMGMTLPMEQDGQMARFLLGTWDGPGMSLVVMREGNEVVVPLDW